jgi:hypothetical protein
MMELHSGRRVWYNRLDRTATVCEPVPELPPVPDCIPVTKQIDVLLKSTKSSA